MKEYFSCFCFGWMASYNWFWLSCWSALMWLKLGSYSLFSHLMCVVFAYDSKCLFKTSMLFHKGLIKWHGCKFLWLTSIYIYNYPWFEGLYGINCFQLGVKPKRFFICKRNTTQTKLELRVSVVAFYMIYWFMFFNSTGRW